MIEEFGNRFHWNQLCIKYGYKEYIKIGIQLNIENKMFLFNQKIYMIGDSYDVAYFTVNGENKIKYLYIW